MACSSALIQQQYYLYCRKQWESWRKLDTNKFNQILHMSMKGSVKALGKPFIVSDISTIIDDSHFFLYLSDRATGEKIPIVWSNKDIEELGNDEEKQKLFWHNIIENAINSLDDVLEYRATGTLTPLEADE